jgi:hypothetical protein
MKRDNIIAAIGFGFFGLWLIFVGTVIYVAWHFVNKYW